MLVLILDFDQPQVMNHVTLFLHAYIGSVGSELVLIRRGKIVYPNNKDSEEQSKSRTGYYLFNKLDSCLAMIANETSTDRHWVEKSISTGLLYCSKHQPKDARILILSGISLF